MKKRMLVIILVTVVAVLALLALSVLIVNRIVVNKSSKSEITDCKNEYSISEKYDCIVVLGAGVKEDGTPSNMLEDRLRGAVEIYKLGVSEKIMLSGDFSGEHYDEVSAMVNYCLENGVPQDAIVRDEVGFSTFETMYNAVIENGYKKIIVVTQEYHLYRAIYIAQKLGAQADGFSTDYRSYFMQFKRDVREVFARYKDFFKVSFTKID